MRVPLPQARVRQVTRDTTAVIEKAGILRALLMARASGGRAPRQPPEQLIDSLMPGKVAPHSCVWGTRVQAQATGMHVAWDHGVTV